jgi:hypothetical protein
MFERHLFNHTLSSYRRRILIRSIDVEVFASILGVTPAAGRFSSRDDLCCSLDPLLPYLVGSRLIIVITGTFQLLAKVRGLHFRSVSFDAPSWFVVSLTHAIFATMQDDEPFKVVRVHPKISISE